MAANGLPVCLHMQVDVLDTSHTSQEEAAVHRAHWAPLSPVDCEIASSELSCAELLPLRHYRGTRVGQLRLLDGVLERSAMARRALLMFANCLPKSPTLPSRHTPPRPVKARGAFFGAGPTSCQRLFCGGAIQTKRGRRWRAGFQALIEFAKT
jgi:hypothetical protein